MVKVEFIESYIKQGNEYIWNDNHGELIRCKDCRYCDDSGKSRALICTNWYIDVEPEPDFYCGYGMRK